MREQQPQVQVCRLWQRGVCRAGSTCLFAHAPKRPEAAVQRSTGSSGSSRKSWADQSEYIWPQQDQPAAANAPQDQPPTAEVPQVCQAWQRGCCYNGNSCLFRHSPNPCAVVIEHSSIVSSSRSWADGSWSRQSQDCGSDPLPDALGARLGEAGQEADVKHWVWGSSASSSVSVASHSSQPSASKRRQDSPPEDRGTARDGDELERESPDVSGDADLPRFDDRVGIPEFFPDLAADGGQLDKIPLSKSAKRRRERKLAEKRRDMRTSNESMLGPIVEAMGSLSPSCIDEARQRLCSSCRSPGPAPSPRVPVPPPTPRWKVNRIKLDAEDGEGDGEDLEEAMSQDEQYCCRDGKGSMYTVSL